MCPTSKYEVHGGQNVGYSVSMAKPFSYYRLQDLVIVSITWVFIFNQAGQFNKHSWKKKQNNTENSSSKMLPICKMCWQQNDFSFEMINTFNSTLFCIY